MNDLGAVGFCPQPVIIFRREECQRPHCAVCGHRRHTAIHMHPYQDPDGPPCGHRFESKTKKAPSDRGQANG